MKKLIVVIIAFVIAVLPLPAKAMEIWEVINTIAEEAFIVEGPWFSIEPQALDLREEMIVNFDFRCSQDRSVCGAPPPLALFLSPGRDDIQLEMTLSRGEINIPLLGNPEGTLPAEIILKTSVGNLSPAGLAEIIRAILSAEKMALVLDRHVSLGSSFMGPSEGGDLPSNYRIEAWFRILFVMFEVAHEEEAIPDRG